MVRKDSATIRIGIAFQATSHRGAVENIIAEHQPGRFVTDEIGGDGESGGQPIGHFLHREGNTDAELAAVPEEPVERRGIFGRCNNHDIANPGEHERAQGIVDHRFVIHGYQLLGGAQRNGMKSSAGASGQNDSTHRVIFAYLQAGRHRPGRFRVLAGRLRPR